MQKEYSKEFHMPGNFSALATFLSLLILTIYFVIISYNKFMSFDSERGIAFFTSNIDMLIVYLVYLLIILFLLKAIYYSIKGYKIKFTDEGLFMKNKKKAFIYWGDYKGFSINGTLVTFTRKHKDIGPSKIEMDFGNLAHWIEPELKRQLPKLPPKKHSALQRLIKKVLKGT